MAEETEKPLDQQAREQTGQRQVSLRIDDREMTTIYANAFRSNGSAEEMMLDFGINVVGSSPAQAGKPAQPEILFKVNNRVVMNWYSAKRLAITLAQLIRRHEEQFGAMELDVAKRAKK